MTGRERCLLIAIRLNRGLRYRAVFTTMLFLALAATGRVPAEERTPQADSAGAGSTASAGSSDGASNEVPSFYVRAVTGPLAGKSVCYVCRNGDRPVVIVLLRELGPETTALLKDLDRTVNRHRADGLRCFAVLLSNTAQRDSARLQTLAFDEKIDLPLTIAGETIVQGSTLAFPRESAVCVVGYQDRQVVNRSSFKSGNCDAAARRDILAATEKMLASKEK
jgi:hypothetical protein